MTRGRMHHTGPETLWHTAGTQSGDPFGLSQDFTYQHAEYAIVSTAPSEVEERVRTYFRAAPRHRYQSAMGILCYVTAADHPNVAIDAVVDAAAKARAGDRISLGADLVGVIAPDPIRMAYLHLQNLTAYPPRPIDHDVLDILMRSIARTGTPQAKSAFDLFLANESEQVRECAIDGLVFFNDDDADFARSRLIHVFTSDPSPRLRLLAEEYLEEE